MGGEGTLVSLVFAESAKQARKAVKRDGEKASIVVFPYKAWSLKASLLVSFSIRIIFTLFPFLHTYLLPSSPNNPYCVMSFACFHFNICPGSLFSFSVAVHACLYSPYMKMSLDRIHEGWPTLHTYTLEPLQHLGATPGAGEVRVVAMVSCALALISLCDKVVKSVVIHCLNKVFW